MAGRTGVCDGKVRIDYVMLSYALICCITVFVRTDVLTSCCVTCNASVVVVVVVLALWGKHTPVTNEKYRQEHHTYNETTVKANDMFPAVTVRDPYKWLQSVSHQMRL
jgi:hypothetical protein